MKAPLLLLAIALLLTPLGALADGAAMYFRAETSRLEASCLADVHSLKDWEARRPELRREAAEMLGLDPMPPRTDLHPVVTGTQDGGDFTVENLYFESMPHLYVTANLYLPKGRSTPAPTVLYMCGHSPVLVKGVSYGNKTAYQQWGSWLARNGYVCLVIDTVQWGEILGHHWGTYRDNQWWWNARGYTPAGVETWDGIRALDYLCTRPEVDTNRLAVTGRSGGGAYSWFVAALDDRVKAMAPTAGMADLQSYVTDGAVDGHCDCMFFVNTYRWDYPTLAALCAPRPLLLVNTDSDPLFPLDGVMRLHDKVKKIYDLYGAATNFGLVIGPGPHADTENLQIPVLRWFNAHLRQSDPLITNAAMPMFPKSSLRVFKQLPGDQINTRIEESFVPAAPAPAVPKTAGAWRKMREGWLAGLRQKCFAGWPVESGPPGVKQIFSETNGIVEFAGYNIESQPGVTLRLYLARKAGQGAPRETYLCLATTNAALPNHPTMRDVFATYGPPESLVAHDAAIAVFYPRDFEPITGARGKPVNRTQFRRRFMLLGQTLDGMRVWDIRRAVQALETIGPVRKSALSITASGDLGVDALYASLFETNLAALDLRDIPSSHRDGPDYLNVLKILDIPEAIAMAAENCPVRLSPSEPAGWDFLRAMQESRAANLVLEFVPGD